MSLENYCLDQDWNLQPFDSESNIWLTWPWLAILCHSDLPTNKPSGIEGLHMLHEFKTAILVAVVLACSWSFQCRFVVPSLSSSLLPTYLLSICQTNGAENFSWELDQFIGQFQKYILNFMFIASICMFTFIASIHMPSYPPTEQYFLQALIYFSWHFSLLCFLGSFFAFWCCCWWWSRPLFYFG